VFQRIRLTDENEPAERTTSECQNPKLGSEIARSVNTKPGNTNNKESDEENDEALSVFKRIRLRVSSPGTGTDGTRQYRTPPYPNWPGGDSIAGHVEYLTSDSVSSTHGLFDEEGPDTLLMRHKNRIYDLHFRPTRPVEKQTYVYCCQCKHGPVLLRIHPSCVACNRHVHCNNCKREIG
jgi:hypothetical protein